MGNITSVAAPAAATYIHFSAPTPQSRSIRLADGDVMQVHWDGFGRPLRNAVRRVGGDEVPVVVREV
jgi:hypothetical protein